MNGAVHYILPLGTTDATLDLVGGKGRSLARMAMAGLPVPAGFHLTTSAYQRFIQENNIRDTLLEISTSAIRQGGAAIESAFADIQTLFEESVMPEEIGGMISQAYVSLTNNEQPVAVRSSATAEDLPGLSFAGQQESYLNIRGEAALLAAVRGCWASLWNARAISYRHQMGIDHETIQMAVVVQEMVPAEVSGILFTANPISGERSELIVNAGFGLGEAIVGGQVTPDTYVLDRDSLKVKNTIIAAKERMVVPDARQGTVVQALPERQRHRSSLAAAALNELCSLALSAEKAFDNLPQDLEWAFASGKCWLLQSRPITNLRVAPLQDVRWDPPYPGAKLIRRQVVENMPGPLSPLFAELYLEEGLEQSLDAFMATFSMPFDIGEVVTRPYFTTVNGYAYSRADFKVPWRRIPGILRFYFTSIPNLIRNAIPHWQDRALPAYLAVIQQWRNIDTAKSSDEQLLAGIRELAIADAMYWFDVAIVIAMAKMTDGLLHFFLKQFAAKRGLTSGMFLSGFPSQTVQAQVDLESIAKMATEKQTLSDLVNVTPAFELLDALQRNEEGRSILQAIKSYLDQYGHQIYTLDFAEPTQAEDPLPVLLSLKELVRNADKSTSARRAELVRQRQSRMTQAMQYFGPVRRWLFQKLLHWAEIFGPHREQALFYIGAGWMDLRRLAQELGSRLVAAGSLSSPSHVYYLLRGELEEACRARSMNQALPALMQLAIDRRELREGRKRLHPPGMVPPKARYRLGPFDFSAFETQMRNPNEGKLLKGFAVSPGRVTAPASVILSTADFDKMVPGNILVCATTTPAWTPLFSQALGLVTDIGGVLAHGSIVAREYGIPAVMGTGNITQRVVNGQQITIDGDQGTVELGDMDPKPKQTGT